MFKLVFALVSLNIFSLTVLACPDFSGTYDYEHKKDQWVKMQVIQHGCDLITFSSTDKALKNEWLYGVFSPIQICNSYSKPIDTFSVRLPSMEYKLYHAAYPGICRIKQISFKPNKLVLLMDVRSPGTTPSDFSPLVGELNFITEASGRKLIKENLSYLFEYDFTGL